METVVLDRNETQIHQGSRVKAETETEVEHGEVTHVGDPDGDVDDEGRPFGINPSVLVKWDDGTEESFASVWTAHGPWEEEAPYEVDELEVVNG